MNTFNKHSIITFANTSIIITMYILVFLYIIHRKHTTTVSWLTMQVINIIWFNTSDLKFNSHHGSFSGPIKASKMSWYNPEVSSVISWVRVVLYLLLYSSFISSMSISARLTTPLVSVSSFVPSPSIDPLRTYKYKKGDNWQIRHNRLFTCKFKYQS